MHNNNKLPTINFEILIIITESTIGRHVVVCNL